VRLKRCGSAMEKSPSKARHVTMGDLVTAIKNKQTYLEMEG
jgi:hypothetical protein